MTAINVGFRLCLPLLLISCAEVNNPGITKRDIGNVPVEKLLLKTPRTYVTRGDSLELMVAGIQASYVCSEITRMLIFQNDSNYLQPEVDVLLPGTIDECSLSPESGFDTIINISLSEFDMTGSLIILTNSAGETTDEALLTDYPHQADQRDFEVLDSIPSGVLPADIFYGITDSLKLACGERLSYAGYCVNEDLDSLILDMSSTVGWPVDSCTAGDLVDVNHEYFRFFKAPTAEACRDSLAGM